MELPSVDSTEVDRGAPTIADSKDATPHVAADEVHSKGATPNIADDEVHSKGATPHIADDEAVHSFLRSLTPRFPDYEVHSFLHCSMSCVADDKAIHFFLQFSTPHISDDEVHSVFLSLPQSR